MYEPCLKQPQTASHAARDQSGNLASEFYIPALLVELMGNAIDLLFPENWTTTLDEAGHIPTAKDRHIASCAEGHPPPGESQNRLDLDFFARA